MNHELHELIETAFLRKMEKNQELIDVLRKVRNDHRKLEIPEETRQPNASSFESGFSFGSGILGVILLGTIIPFVLSAFISAVNEVTLNGTEIAGKPIAPKPTTTSEMLMWLLAAYAFIAIIGFIWYSGKRTKG